MKIIKGENLKVKSSMKWIEIKYNQKGEAYFLKNGRIENLSDYMRLYNSMWYQPIDGLNFLHAVDSKNCYNPDYIELDNAGEAVRIWYIAS